MAEIEEHEALEQVLGDNEQVEEVVYDFDGMSDEDLLSVLKKMSVDSIAVIESKLSSIKDVFFERYNQSKKEAFQKFVDEGGFKDDFEFRESGVTSQVKASINKFTDQVKTYYVDKKEQLQQTSRRKNLYWQS